MLETPKLNQFLLRTQTLLSLTYKVPLPIRDITTDVPPIRFV